MENNTIGKIAIKTADKRKAFFNWSHDVYSTASIGDLQPSLCKMVLPNSKIVQSRKDLIRLAPMVAPAFTRMSRKDFYCFVSLSELSENFAHMLAQTPVSRGANTFYPAQVPAISRGLLSYLVLIGAKCTIHHQQVSGDTPIEADNRVCEVVNSSNATQLQLFFDMMVQDNRQAIFKFAEHSVEFPHFVGTTLDLGYLIGNTFGAVAETGLHIPLANKNALSFFDDYDYTHDSATPPAAQAGVNYPYVPLDTADMVIDCEGRNGMKMSLAFRLSDFGKRLRKILIGCGYQLDISSRQMVSLIPLFAVYKAYYELFGLKLYENYYTTSLYKLLTSIDFYNWKNFNAHFKKNEFVSFIYDLGNLWMTEQQDYTSAHVTSTAISPDADNLSADFIDVPDAHIEEVNVRTPQENVGVNGHSYIASINHGQLDSEFLKRLYMWTNRNTIAGREVEKLLRAQGLGDFCDSCRSHFIGYEETPINVMDVVSTADTLNGSEGSPLGDYAGRGLGWKKKNPKTFVYETREYGYFICLSAIVPNAGYVQQLDPTLLAIDKFALYNPEFDGLGYEMTSKAEICGERNWSEPVIEDENNRMDAAFGMVPRYTGLKIATSKINGDFSRRGTRDRHLVYNLDKVIFVGDKQVMSVETPEAHASVVKNLLVPARFPIAGNVWRYINRYPWLSHFERIFLSHGRDFSNEHVYYDTQEAEDELETKYDLIMQTDDNFMLFDVNNCRCYTRALPIEKSFETFDEDGEGPNGAMSKT